MAQQGTTEPQDNRSTCNPLISALDDLIQKEHQVSEALQNCERQAAAKRQQAEDFQREYRQMMENHRDGLRYRSFDSGSRMDIAMERKLRQSRERLKTVDADAQCNPQMVWPYSTSVDGQIIAGEANVNLNHLRDSLRRSADLVVKRMHLRPECRGLLKELSVKGTVGYSVKEGIHGDVTIEW